MRHLAFLLLLCLPASAQVAKFTAPQSSQGRGAPVSPPEWASGAVSVGTAGQFPFATDLGAPQSVEAFVQNIRFVNRGSDWVCFAPVLRSGTCAASCAASTITCSGAATDGDAIAAGTSYSIALTGNSCGCLAAKTAATVVSAVRIGRFPT